MKEFMLLFRHPNFGGLSKSSPQEMQILQKKWHDWAAGISAQSKLSSSGMRLPLEGKVIRAGGVITDGPFVEIREMLGSFIIVKAENIDEAVTLGHGCPILEGGGSVEVRPILPIN
jgi:hypothetical protein